MRYRLIAIDLDGTLYNDQKVITPATRAALLRAQSDGVRLMIASARPVPGLYTTRDSLDMRRYDGILMAYNGGRILSAADGRELSAETMSLADAKQMLQYLKTLPVTPILDDGAQFYVTDTAGYKVEFECRNNCMTCTQVDDLAEFINFAPAKILMSVAEREIYDVQARIAAALPEGLTVVQTAPFYLEINPIRVNKGRALVEVCGLLGIDPAQTIAFGDSENDIPMLRAAGVGVAMGNATDAAKAAADRIAPSNNEDGIARALEALLQ